jgi:hypothetical protein
MRFPAVLETTQIYLYMVGGMFALVVLGVLLVQTVRHGFRIRLALPSVTRVTCFLVVLLLVGAIGQIVWTSYIWGRLYYSADYVFGYLPMLPISQSEIDAEFGGQQGALNGVTLTELNTIWLIITAIVWGVAILIYRRIWSGVALPAPKPPIGVSSH